MSGSLSKLGALHAVFGIACPYTGDERQVAAVLLLDHNPKRGGAYRGIEGIAKRAGLSRRQTARALKSLVTRTDGPLVVTSKPQAKRDGSGGRAPNLYSIELRASQATNRPRVECHDDIQPSRGLSAKSEGVECQNGGGLSAHQAQDLSRDMSSDLGSNGAPQSDTPPLALENPTLKPEPKPKGDSRIVELRKHYVAVYRQAKGGKAPLLTQKQWPHAMRCFKELLLATKELELAKSIISKAFDDPWHCENGCQPWEILKNANKLHGAAVGPRKANGRASTPQSGLAASYRQGEI